MTAIPADYVAALIGAFGAVLVLFLQWMREFFQEISSRDKWIGRLRRISPEVNAAFLSLTNDGRGVFSFVPPLLAVLPLLIFLVPPLGASSPVDRLELAGIIVIFGFVAIHLLGAHALPNLLHSRVASDATFRSKVSNRYMLLNFYLNYLGACVYVAGTNVFDLMTSGTSINWQDLVFGPGFDKLTRPLSENPECRKTVENM
ncbi:MAG: hypothetical protein KGJ23_09510 [Euryarchaeota archaeon]|nr:hypothetical protein [Euryarchaeota archaeon]MDE2044823.1 hypothetical protein [Thermoplasmata archaeon]